MPISPRQLAANRRNAQRSTGPKTEEGRAAVRMNALRHGLRAQTVILPYEDAEDFHALRNNFIRDYAPVDSTELSLVDQLAQNLWRLHRMRRFETAMLDNQLNTMKRKLKVDDSPGDKHEHINNDEGLAVWLQVTPHNDMRSYFRYEGNIERNYYRALHELQRAQAERRKDEQRGLREASDPEFSQDMILPEEDVQQLAAAVPRPKLVHKPRPNGLRTSQKPAPGQVSDSGNGSVRTPSTHEPAAPQNPPEPSAPGQ